MQIKKDNKLMHISMEGALIFIPASLTALILALICIKFENVINISANTYFVVISNFILAAGILTMINKKQKDNELKISNCFKELDSLHLLITDLRTTLKVPNDFDSDDLTRYMALINLQIYLIKNYKKFIEEEHLIKLTSYYTDLNNKLTGSNTVDDNYKYPLLLIEKRILVIKSKIL
jgi:hypothetical protein